MKSFKYSVKIVENMVRVLDQYLTGEGVLDVVVFLSFFNCCRLLLIKIQS